jgi:hypothetical protein
LRRTSTRFRSSMEVGSPAFSVAGRLLLLLSALLLAATPWTEYFWDFDHFLQGGQDLEFGLLSVLTVLCLVLVVWWHTKQRLGSIVSVLRLASRLRGQKNAPASGDRRALPSLSLAFYKTDSPLHSYQPPLLV